MDEDEFEYDEEWQAPTSRKIQRMDLAVLGLHLVAGMTNAVAQTVTLALQTVVGHANYTTDQRLFHEQAALEIETLTTEE